MIDDSKIQRINELARKSKAEGLTETEKKEQQLRDTSQLINPSVFLFILQNSGHLFSPFSHTG